MADVKQHSLPALTGMRGLAARRLWLLLAVCCCASVGLRYFVVVSVGGVSPSPVLSYQLQGSLDTFGLGLGVIVLLLTCAQGVRVLDLLLANRAVFFLGTVSYGVYLWHYPVGRWLLDSELFRDYEGYPFYWLTLAMLVASLLLASLSWYGVEQRAISAARTRKPQSPANASESWHE